MKMDNGEYKRFEAKKSKEEGCRNIIQGILLSEKELYFGMRDSK